MRILFVNPYYKPYLGGIERIIERLSAELQTHPGVEAVGVLTTRVYFPDRVIHELPGHEIIDGVEIFRTTFKPSALPRLFHASNAGYISMDVPRILRRFKPDIIHFTYSEWWSANLAIYLSSRQTAHVLSTFFHDLPLVKRTLPLYLVNRWLTSRLGAVHVLTEVEREQVCRAYRTPRRRIVVIPPGVDVPEDIPDRSKRETVTILAVGRLNEHKGQLQLVEMVNQLLVEEPGLQIRVWLAGDDAGMVTAIAEFIAQQNLAAVVKILGYCTDEQLQDLYRQADIFALPTQYESFGLVFTEAMSHALPVITYGVGPIPSILKKGAIIVPPGDQEAFVVAMRCLVHERSRRLQLGLEGRQLASQLYSWRVTGERFLALYERLSNKTMRAGRQQR